MIVKLALSQMTTGEPENNIIVNLLALIIECLLRVGLARYAELRGWETKKKEREKKEGGEKEKTKLQN